MKDSSIRLIPGIVSAFLLFLNTALSGGEPPSFRPGKDYALLFAVNNYDNDKGAGAWRDLAGPIADAEDIAADLRELYGFQAEVVPNPSLEDIYRKLDALRGREYPDDAQLFIFFSGHGHFLEAAGEGFFIPRDGKRAGEDPTQASWLSLLRLRRQLSTLPVRHVLMAIDACYSGTVDDRIAFKDFDRPGEPAGISQEVLLADMLRARSRLYCTSGGKERTPDPSGFASQWKAALRSLGGSDGLLTLRELEEEYFPRVQPQPRMGYFEGNEPGGKFVFVYQAFQTKSDDAMARDRAAWSAAKAAGTLAAYRQYVKDFPAGDFVPAANAKIRELDDAAAWSAAKAAGTAQAYDDFLTRFPNSLYADAARANRDALLQKPDLLEPTTPGPSKAPERIDDPLAGIFILVRGGSFDMGCTSEQQDCYDDEKPVRRVTLDDYYIGQMEVTQAQWKAIMGDNPSYFKDCDNCPVEQVSWNDVQDFIRKLNARSGGERYRLPTEAEWEFAARGGTQSKGFQYSGSKNVGDVAWYNGNSGRKTHPEGRKANELGLYNMSGNVYEWCADWYGTYPGKPERNPTGPESGSYRVVRGGSWVSYPQGCRVANRLSYTPDVRDDSLGFRLARTK